MQAVFKVTSMRDSTWRFRVSCWFQPSSQRKQTPSLQGFPVMSVQSFKGKIFFCGLSPPGKALLPPHTLPSLTRLASYLSSSPSHPHLLPLPANQISFKLFRSKREDFKVWIYIKNIDSRHSSASVCQFVEMKIRTCSLFSSWGWLLWVLGCMKSIQLLSEP